MAENWTAIAAEVDAALRSIGTTDAGFSATLTQTVTTGGDAWDPTSGTTTTTSTEVTIVVTDYAKTDIDGALIQQGDRKVLMTATAGVEPVPADVLTISGVNYNIVDVTPLAPAGVNIMFETQVRR